MAEEEQTGTVLRAEDGTLYFIRDEVLELCKVAPEEVEITQKMMEEHEQEVSGFALAAGTGGVQLVSAVPVRYSSSTSSDLGVKPRIGSGLDTSRVPSTIMCCW